MRHHVRKQQRHARASLIKAARAGGIALVLGAGVSISRGVPSWAGLVKALWDEVAHRPSPKWLANAATPPHPLGLQIVLEEIEFYLRRHLAQQDGIGYEAVDKRLVERELAARIGQKLYANESPANTFDTLEILVELLRADQRRTSRRIAQVITFNADDLLEREANRDTRGGEAPVLWPVPRASFHPRRSRGANDCAPITVYHLHGFLPKSRAYKRRAPDTLVFTDAQYWESVANPASFANRVMSMALQEYRCVFIGMSMTDVNLMRWLGLRQIEFMADRVSHYEVQGKGRAAAEDKAREALGRHYWISAESDDPERLIASHLERRGVATVTLPEWGEPFSALMEECFGAAK